MVVPIAEDPRARGGSWTIGRPPEPMHAELVRQPRFDDLRLMATVVVHDDRDASPPGGWRRVVQSRAEGPKPGRGFARAQAMHQRPGRALEGTGESVRGMLA